MKTHKFVALWSAVCLLVLTAAWVSADPREGGKRKLFDFSGGPRSFAFSTDFSGRIGDDMLVNGVRYRMSRDVAVYVVGEGMRDQGTTVDKRSIYLAGHMKGDDGIVTAVVVRPPATTVDGADLSTHVKVRPVGAPQ